MTLTRISRTSGTKAQRIQSSYVNRMTEASGINKIEQIQRIEELKNPTDQPSENQLLSYERYYQKFTEVKQEFHTFYQHNQESINALKKLENKEDTIFSQIQDFTHNYNKALLALKNYDALVGSNQQSVLHHLYLTHSGIFQILGLLENKDYSLSFHSEVFLNNRNKSDMSSEEWLSTTKGMLLEQFKSLTIGNHRSDRTAYEPDFDFKGLIIEEEG